jgi:DNA-binding MarR family transcriptional regulator
MTEKSELPLALRAAYLAMHRHSDAQFAAHGVTADQFVLLATLARGTALTQRELARRMPSDPSTVRAMLVLLEKQGVVERDVHPSDSRARTVALTAAGKRKFRQLWNAGESIRTQMSEAIEPAEASELVRLLTRIAESLNQGVLSASQQTNENGARVSPAS